MFKKDIDRQDRNKQKTLYIDRTPKSKLHLVHQNTHKDITQLISITKQNKNYPTLQPTPKN